MAELKQCISDMNPSRYRDDTQRKLGRENGRVAAWRERGRLD